MRLAEEPASKNALVLGVRDLARDGAPKMNRFSNAFSNLFVSAFSGRKLADTQCGLRRYPVLQTLKLGARDHGYGFEAEVILRPVRVVYPPPELRMTHFHAVRDPAKIVFRVLHTVLTAPRAT